LILFRWHDIEQRAGGYGIWVVCCVSEQLIVTTIQAQQLLHALVALQLRPFGKSKGFMAGPLNRKLRDSPVQTIFSRDRDRKPVRVGKEIAKAAQSG
jgi:hypothetical protein